MTELWHRCRLALGDMQREDFIKHRSALVGTTFKIGRDRWEVVSVEYPGLPLDRVRELAGLTRG